MRKESRMNGLLHEDEDYKINLELEENLDSDSLDLWEHGFLKGYYFDEEWELLL